MSEFVNKIKNTIKKYNMLDRGQSLCVAVSGGVDSMVLLHVLYRLKDELSLNLSVCHVNHNLRSAESRRDIVFVKDASRSMGIRFVSRTLKKGELLKEKGVSLQSVARDRRLRALEDMRKELEAGAIALGHNSGDSVETFLMRVLKGCGLKGLCGIPQTRGVFIRPLIEISREEIARYAKQEGIRYVEDSTNKTDKYLRNSVRLKLVPFIEKHYNPSIKDTVSRTQSALQRDESFIEATGKLAYLSAVIEEGKGFVAFDRKTLLSLHEALSARVFLMAARIVKAKTGREEYAHTVEDFLLLVSNDKPNAIIKLHEGLYARREYDKVFVSRTKPRTLRREVEARLKAPGRTKFGGFEFVATVTNKRPKDFSSKMIAYFDFKGLSATLKIRTFRHGDRIVPLGMKGHKKLKDIFVDGKVSATERLNTPVITSGGEVLWVVGFRQSELFKVKEETGKILKLEVVRVRGKL